jgi:phosphatidylserine/phosphatidylglycerophosphate/cardiolipin synthase-like enzyme
MNRNFRLALALLGCLAAWSPPMSARAQQWAVYFSPGGGATEAIVRAVDKARISLYVQAYIISSSAIVKAISAAHRRGVLVKVILDQGQLTDNFSALPSLLAARVPIWIDAAHQIAHNKIMIIDGETVITGSFNFTRSAEYYNAENLLVIRDKALADRYEANFQEHLRHSQPYGEKKDWRPSFLRNRAPY